MTTVLENEKKYVNRFTRGLFFLVGDTTTLLLSAFVAYLILLPFDYSQRPFPIQHSFIIIVSILTGLMIFRMYPVSWRYTSLRDLVRIILGITIGGAFSLGVSQFYIEMGNYEMVFTALFLINAILGVSGFRISKRLYYIFIRSSRKAQKHTIIFGAGSEGEQILRDIITNEHWNLKVHAIFDDEEMLGLRLHGIQIVGGKNKMMQYLKFNPVDVLIVACPDFPKKELKEVIDEVKSLRPDIDIKILPSFHSLTDDPVGVRNIRDVSFEDILGRKPVKIDLNTMKASVSGKTVLVTGGGGSIGSELVRQCAKLKPEKLIALDIDETDLFYIENELKTEEIKVIPYVASVTDECKINRILGELKPDIIFHAAAYKHVPMMESFPDEAVRVNIGGTRSMASLACKHGVEKFVLISTDKAVNPTNVMGATKRVAEEICAAYNNKTVTKFISVRFGNVLGSRGSVVPLFIEQIKNGGPVTVTDPQMKRYFMTIPEAVLLVIQASSMGEGGEVFVLDMGEPVKILDMAKDLIRFHSLEPYKDIQIKITGKRPGEKLFEELLNAEEGILKTNHDEIHKAICSRKMTFEELETEIGKLVDQLRSGSMNSFRNILKTIVPTYSYADNGQVFEEPFSPERPEMSRPEKLNIKVTKA